MPQPNQEANVEIHFAGLYLLCVNTQKNNQCEVGLLDCQHHDLVFDLLQVIKGSGKQPPRSRRKELPSSLDRTKDIWISTDPSTPKGVSKYFNEKTPFDSVRGKGDPQDFRWVVDLEGPHFGTQKFTIRPNGNTPKSLTPKIYVNAGELYTARQSNEVFLADSLSDDNHDQVIGQVAYTVGLRLHCKELFFSNTDPSSLSDRRNLFSVTLEKGTKYLITIDNRCRVSKRNLNHTDFVFYYDAGSYQSKEKFDLRRYIKKKYPWVPGLQIPGSGNANFLQDDHEVLCIGGTLSQTDSLTQSSLQDKK